MVGPEFPGCSHGLAVFIVDTDQRLHGEHSEVLGIRIYQWGVLTSKSLWRKYNIMRDEQTERHNYQILKDIEPKLLQGPGRPSKWVKWAKCKRKRIVGPVANWRALLDPPKRAASHQPYSFQCGNVSATHPGILMVQEKLEKSFTTIGLPTYWLSVVMTCIDQTKHYMAALTLWTIAL